MKLDLLFLLLVPNFSDGDRRKIWGATNINALLFIDAAEKEGNYVIHYTPYYILYARVKRSFNYCSCHFNLLKIVKLLLILYAGGNILFKAGIGNLQTGKSSKCNVQDHNKHQRGHQAHKDT